MSSDFASALLRLKEQTQLHADKDVAELLGLSDKAFHARKARGAFPEDKVFSLATRRPDLGIDPNYVMTGVSAKKQAQAMVQNFGARLVEVRGERTPETFAKLLGISPRELELVETGALPPTGDLVARLIAAHPERSPVWLAGGEAPSLDEPLTDLEVVLVKNYRVAPEPGKVEIRETAAAWASGARASPSTSPAITTKRIRGGGVEMVVHGSVGQRLDGVVHGSNTVVMGNVGKVPKPKK